MVIIEQKTKRVTIHLPIETVKKIEKLATKNNQDTSKEIRKAIDGYLNIQATKDDIDFISKIIRQEVKVEIEKQANRICAMIYKIGTISAANYYLSSRALTDLINPSFQVDFKDMAEHSRKLGLLYMNKGVSEINKFLLDEEAVQREIDKISNKNFEV